MLHSFILVNMCMHQIAVTSPIVVLLFTRTGAHTVIIRLNRPRHFRTKFRITLCVSWFAVTSRMFQRQTLSCLPHLTCNSRCTIGDLTLAALDPLGSSTPCTCTASSPTLWRDSAATVGSAWSCRKSWRSTEPPSSTQFVKIWEMISSFCFLTNTEITSSRS